MIRKPVEPKPLDKNDTRSIVIVPSRIGNDFEATDGVEEAEIAAEISLPADDAWGWVVVAASFFSIFLLDGVFFTFGSIYLDIIADTQIDPILVALVNSVAVALYFLFGPVTSGLINRFGFRACTMAGSMIISSALLCTYFATTYITIFIFYGVIAGFGGCLIGMSAAIVVGFYFERLRSLALSIAGVGSSVGIMVMFTVNTYLVQLAGWRITTLIHSGLLGLVYFLGMAYIPLLSVSVTKTTDDATRTVTYLPSLMKTDIDRIRASPSRTRREGITPTATERLFSAVSNAHFPTATSILEEGVVAQGPSTQAGPSAASVSKLTIMPRNTLNANSRRQLKQVQSIASRLSDQTQERAYEFTLQMKQPAATPRKQKWWNRICHWHEHVAESRPMYRDDAFYHGRLENLPLYQKSTMEIAPEARTGIEYQMAVSRAVTTADLQERGGLFTTAVRRVLATMLDPKLLKRCSFLILCLGGFLTYVGLLIPYVFLTDRNKSEGIDPQLCKWFVSVIGLANSIGRVISGIAASKFNPLTLYITASILSGIGTIAFNMSFNVYYQYFCCVFFGLFIASISSLRSLVLVDLYGLEKLTNATGMLLMFQGFGSLISTPMSSALKSMFGYTVSFYVAGITLLMSGVVVLPVRKIVTSEDRREASKQSKEATAPKPINNK